MTHEHFDTALKPGVPITVSVCVTCRARDQADAALKGPKIQADLAAAFEQQGLAAVARPVQCLSVCQRPVSLAVAAPDGYVFVFGDIESDADTADVAQFVASYAAADYGFVPWRARPAALRAKLVARLPPVAWSPADGRAPA